MKVLVTGASGFIGHALTRHLAARGHAVRAMIRCAGEVSLATETVVADMRDFEALARAADGVECVVHLACATGIARESVVRAVNVHGTRALLEASRSRRVRRFVFISSVSAVRRRMGPYGRSKREGEVLVAASGLEWVILRPSLVYGPGEDGLFARLERALRSLPVVPVVGDGRLPVDPLDVRDLCEVIEQCLSRPDVVGKAYDLLGPERLSFDELLRRLAATWGVHPRLLHIPATVALPLARLLGAISERPPLSEDNVLGMISEALVDGEPARRDFAILWTRFDAGLERLRHAA